MLRPRARPHTYISIYAKTPMHAQPPMQMTARAFCKKRDPAAGLGVMLVGRVGLLMKAGGIALLAPDSCSSCVCRSGSDVRGQLRQRARAVGPAELAVVFGGLGCSGSIPGSPWYGR